MSAEAIHPLPRRPHWCEEHRDYEDESGLHAPFVFEPAPPPMTLGRIGGLTRERFLAAGGCPHCWPPGPEDT